MHAAALLCWHCWAVAAASQHRDQAVFRGEQHVARATAESESGYLSPPPFDSSVSLVALSLVQTNAYSIGSRSSQDEVPRTAKPGQNVSSVEIVRDAATEAKDGRYVDAAAGQETARRRLEEDILAVILLLGVISGGVYYVHTKKDKKQDDEEEEEAEWDDMIVMQAVKSHAGVSGFQLHILIFGIFVLALNLVMILVVKIEFINPSTLQELTWEPYWVLNVIIISMWLMALGYPSDLVLTAASASCCLVSIITLGDYLAGLSNSGVVAVALLCIISKAIDKTKALNGIMGRCLGSSSRSSVAMFRLAFPVVVLGAVLNNTPLVAVMIPIVNDWCAKNGMEVSHFMMPLSFMAMLSACLTTFGSSTNLLAVDLVPQAGINFFDLMPGGIAIVFVGVAYCALFAPILLPGRRETALPEEPVSEVTPSVELGIKPQPDMVEDCFTRYVVHFVITDGPLIGRAPVDCGLQTCLPPPATITFSEGLTQPFCIGDEFAVHGASADDIAAVQSIPGLSFKLPWSQHRTSDHQRRYHKSLLSEKPTRRRLMNPVRRWVAAAMEGGWVPRQRPLYEVVVPPSGLAADHNSNHYNSWELTKLQVTLSTLNLTLIAARGTDLHALGDKGSLALRGGDVLLVESVGGNLSRRSGRTFGFVSRVPDKMPPEGVRMSPFDPLRAPFAVFGLLLCIVLSAMQIAPLDAAAALVALVLVLVGTLDSRSFYDAINGRVLLTVAASFGIGSAFMKTGLASMLARQVLFVSEGYGTYASMSAVVGMALMLGVIVSNNTTVILLAPMVQDICNRQGLDLKMMMIAVVYAANLSFATPFSYQTNMMVMPHGGYVFTDYVKFGVPLMLLCGGVAIVTTTLVWGPSPV